MVSLPIQLVAIDLDGTLFNSHQQITGRTAAAVRAARTAGIEICIATGRRHTFAWKMLRKLELLPQEIILSSNGAVVRELAGTLLSRTHLARDLSLAVCEAAEQHREHLVFTFDRVDDDPAADHHAGSLLMDGSSQLTTLIERWVTENRADIVYKSPIETGLDQEEAIQAMVCGQVAPMRDLEAQLRLGPLRERLAIHRTEYADRDLCIVDLLPANCGKGVALAGVAAMRGLQAQQVAAIGDNHNDLDMLEFAGRSFLMGNAAPELKGIAERRGWRVTGSNDEDGAALALEALIELNRTGKEPLERCQTRTEMAAGTLV